MQYPKNNDGNFLIEAIIAVFIISFTLFLFIPYSLKINKSMQKTRREYQLIQYVHVLSERLYQSDNKNIIFEHWLHELKEIFPEIEGKLIVHEQQTYFYYLLPDQAKHEIPI